MVLLVPQMARMSRLLDEALGLDEAGRRQWLQALAPEDHDLEAALRRALLPDGKDRAGAPATLPPVGFGAQEPEVAALKPGDRVGPYQLVRELGSGGMAEVWLAQRADGAFKREVALKLPALARLRKDLASRFARERDILASLEHPNIARLYDAGVSPEGLPYLAMEYVAGQPLTAWCDGHQVGVRERLRLFLQVLDAVHYAHARQVLHRDIKPSNILVTDSGQVRLLDFGVAKLLEQEEEHTELTQVYGRALTPEYASPELLRGERVDAASDIYALGVVLYELLAGSRPYRLKTGASLTALEQAVMQAQVQRPSTQVQPDTASARATTVEKLSRRLRGDLDAIVLKALERLPQDRYPSAEALADDVQHYLSGKPVEARPAHPVYLLTKFVLRHRAGVAMSAAATLAVLVAVLLGQSRAPAPAPAAGTTSTPAAFSPPAHSIAVLPFVNMSGDPKQEYFSDGLSEELLNSLATIRDLQVAARTSSFLFKGEKIDLAEVAHKLNVGAVLEGSVRKDGNHARIAAQLINAVTGFQLWSQTYDRDLRNVLSLQTEIATAVTKALQATLMADAAAVIEQGGTQNPQAFDAYLRGKDILIHLGDKARLLASIAAFDEAIHLDRGFAKAYAEKAIAESNFAEYYAGPDVRKRFQQARATAERSLALAPELGAAHAAFGRVLWTGFFEFDRAMAEYQRALALSPNDADVLMRAGQFFSDMGRADAGVTSARRGVALDQLNHRAHSILGSTLEAAHRHREAIEAFSRALALNQNDARAAAFRGLSLLGLGEFESARQSCATPPLDWKNQLCLAIAYDKLHRRREAEAELSAMKAEMEDAAAYQYAEIYAQWGDIPKALDWIETAYRLRDSGLSGLKADAFLDPLRDEPRFQAIERKLKFPA